MRTECYALFAALGLLVGCSQSAGGGACSVSTDCSGGQVCTQGVCGPCSDDGSCAHLGEGASCERGVCVSACGEGGCACAAGDEGCECRAGGTCRAGLACQAGICTACAGGGEGCACRATGDACDAGLACEAGTCVACAPGELGCACAEGACSGELVCTAAELCLAPTTCSVLRDAGLCPEGRVCEVVAGAPRCLAACEIGYQPDESGACAACPEEGCGPPVTCEDCAEMHRVCDESGSVVRCGECSTGFRLDGASGECVDERLCGGVICATNEMPDRRADGSCACVPRVCGAGEAQAPDGSCVTCALTCDAAGETGTIEGRTTAAGECLCATEPGYFIPRGGDGRAAPCDEDADGWVRQTAISTQESGDPALLATLRCDVLEAERVALINEYGQRLSIYSCADGLFVGDSDAVCVTRGGVMPILLVETDRNDSPSLLERAATGIAPRAPAYELDGSGRALSAGELHGLTRACVSEHADFDDDGSADVGQAQATASSARTNAARLAALAYFVELHTFAFEPSMLGGAGTIVIAERSRCDESFPLGYEGTDGPYWRECHRRRDPAFEPSAPMPWQDFAQWSCDGAAGPCTVPLPPTGTSSDPTQAPPHGLCELDTTADWGTQWRGMHHHSQFRCVLASDSSTASHAIRFASIYDAAAADGRHSFQRCFATEPSTSAPFSCAMQPRPLTGAPAQVGWAAVRYETGATLGCIDESVEPHLSSTWARALCPDPGPVEFYAYGAANDFGRLSCGCDAPVTYVLDADRDGFGASGTATTRCAPPATAEGHYIPQRTDGRVDCDDADHRRYPTASDEPDLAGLDSNCDGIDGEASRLVFVAPASGVGPMDGNGTMANPYRSIGHALENAAGRSLALRSGTYTEAATLRLVSGVNLYGGYSADWTSRTTDPSATPILVNGYGERSLSGVPGIGSVLVRTNVAVDASAVRSATKLQLLRIHAVAVTAPAGVPVSYYGIRGNGTSQLTLERVVVEAAPGSAGGSGDGPDAGASGGAGAGGERGGCGKTITNGGGGGASACGGTGGRGGRGDDDGSAYSGANGSGGWTGASAPGGATGGAGGSGGSGGSPRNAGRPGADGHVGQDGAAASSTPLVHDGYWIPRPGWPGATGGSGGGGGGGGGGTGSPSVSGGGGGGGGGGGCGGAGGGGGYGGGGSFAVFLTSATGVRIIDSALIAGSGGRGGNGAAGARGGSGGVGGPAGGSACSSHGGASGGHGGSGGAGGAGAGGGGGDAVALVRTSSSSVIVHATSLAAGTGGEGGTGGSSLNGGRPGMSALSWP